MEGDAGTSQLASQLNPNDEPAAEGSEDDALEAGTEPDTTSAEQHADISDTGQTEARRTERFGRGWVAAICVVLLLATAGVGLVGYLALHSNAKSSTLTNDETVAVAAARDCVTATQAPDVAVMSASQAKMIECSTGDFGAQAALYSGILADAYQAASVKVQVTDMRAAPERHNDDGSISVLVAFRVKVSNSEANDQEQGYRLRVQMAPVDGTWKVAKLEQVTS